MNCGGHTTPKKSSMVVTVQTVSGLLISSEEPVVKMRTSRGKVTCSLELPFFPQDTRSQLEARMMRGIRDMLKKGLTEIVVIDKLNRYTLDKNGIVIKVAP